MERNRQSTLPEFIAAVPEFLAQWLRDNAVLLGSIVGVALSLLVLSIWWAFGKGPRLRRALRFVQRLMQQGDAASAQEQISKLRRSYSLAGAWASRVDQLEGQLLEFQARATLGQGRFEEALGQLFQASQLLGKPDLEARATVQNAMLDEVHRLFSQNAESEIPTILDLLNRALRVQSPCREASFWMGMCFLRVGQLEEALQFLHVARAGTPNWEEETAPGTAATPPAPPSPIIDPSLYLGTVLHRHGRPRDALRFLTEANRLDPNCPLVKLQLGASMVAADRDPNMAVRVLQAALGPKGLGLWSATPQRMWVEAFPDNRSYIRKLALKHPFTCPLWGSDLSALLHQGTFALAQGQYRLGNFQEASESFTRATQEGAPSLPVLRGLGLSLARLNRYDEAFKHLRMAHDMEEPKDRLTAGYLALCGALGTAMDQADVPRNLAWAVHILTGFAAPRDEEWINIINAVFAEARKHNVELSLDDQIYLCEHLLNSNDISPHAAQAYHHLQITHPDSMRPEYAWLFCRAMIEKPLDGPGVLRLFEITFSDTAPARAFFEQRHWDFDAVERAYLERAAALAPGKFPAILGAEYSSRGERLLLAQAATFENQGDLESAASQLKILARLNPHHAGALDGLARLYHRRDADAKALAVLDRWQKIHPADPLPLVRRALLHYRREEFAEGQHHLQQALSRCQGKRRAAVAFLGARLALQAIGHARDGEFPEPVLDAAQQFLHEVLREQSDHPQGLWNLAAICWLRGQRDQLVQLAPRLKQPDVSDPFFHYFAAVCQLEARDYDSVLAACQRVRRLVEASKPNGTPHLPLDLESDFLAGQAKFAQGDMAAAAELLARPARAAECSCMAMAQMLLGLIRYQQQDHEDTVTWWQRIDAGKRAGWKLNEPLATTLFLSALDLFHQKKFEEAAERLRNAGRMGCRDRRLGSVLLLSLFRAGQQAIYG